MLGNRPERGVAKGQLNASIINLSQQVSILGDNQAEMLAIFRSGGTG